MNYADGGFMVYASVGGWVNECMLLSKLQLQQNHWRSVSNLPPTSSPLNGD